MLNLTVKRPLGREVCDFCSSEHPYAIYDAETFKIDTFSVGGLTQNSVGAWFACEECAKLIDADNWEGLAERVADEFFRIYPDMRREVQRPQLIAEFSAMYRQFKAMRKRPD